jgi:8-oxo-dGTP pyrophosphatase MutT (NUDIX family)
LIDLDVAGLRERLRRTPPANAVYADDGAGRQGEVPASVLIPIITHAAGLTVLFTQRTTSLKHHSGQVSFPGGRAEAGDAGPEVTALRETEEELGLARARVEVLARLPEYSTRTGFRVTPVVGLVAPPLELVPDAREVDAVFEVPLAVLLDPGNHRRETREFFGRAATYYVIEHEDKRIWGATAGMIVNLYRMIS